MKKVILAVLLVFITAVPVMAETRIEFPSGFDQADFKAFSEDFGMALSYIPLSPAAPLGDKLPGFDVGIEASYIKLDKNVSYYQKIDAALKANGRGELPSALLIPRVHAQVGLPIIPLDLGVSYASVPDSDIKLVGYELKYAILEGGVATPALAIRGAYTAVSGLDQLDLTTKSIDLSISKGVLIFTPYAGVGQVWIPSEPNSPDAPLLQKEDISQTSSSSVPKSRSSPSSTWSSKATLQMSTSTRQD